MNDTSFDEEELPPSQTTVAIIGSGPGGMFFCHALETRRRTLMNQKEKGGATTAAAAASELAQLPIVTCFERAAGPGGVWRSERTFGDTVPNYHQDDADEKDKRLPERTSSSPSSAPSFDHDKVGTTASTDESTNTATTTTTAPTNRTTNMYEALWTNGPKDCIEFSDYYLDQHFDTHPQLPVYMPRQPVLDYMLGRVTQHCSDFFKKYVQFHTSVDHVRYDPTGTKFEVTTRHVLTGNVVTTHYDKCIWAGGENGRPNIPQTMVDMFRTGGFTGKIIHSSDTADFEADVMGKRILLIGGSYSAEDLALMAVKCGVDRVYISSRQHENVVRWTGAWPYGKVHVLEAQTPVAVTDDGKCIQFAKTWWKWPNQYVPYENVIETEVRDIDVVIFCTGYAPNFGMLDEELRQAVKKDINMKLDVPSEWTMKPNGLSDLLGDVEPGDCRICNSAIGYPGLYRGLAISNPNMMFIVTSVSNPLVGVDVDAWLLLNFVTGVNKIPTAEEMRERNRQDVLDQMNNSYLRYCIDYNYAKAYDDTWNKDVEHRETLSRLYYQSKSDHYTIYWKILARSMQEANYPVSYGTYDELNDKALTLKKYDDLSYYHRTDLNAEDAANGRTFRDCRNSDVFRSIFTGDEAAPLKKRWLDIDVNDENVLEN